MTTVTHNNSTQSPAARLPADKLLQLLYKMMLIRRFEQRTMQNYMAQKIGGFCHIYSGQEGVAVGSIAAVNDDDPIITAYRDHGYALARGTDPKYCMAELFGKVTGVAKGKGGSMHFFDKARHIFGGHAIVGGQLPLAAGLGFAIQYNKENKVCLCYLGDGALNQGAFHEAMNLAGIWRLPILFIIENNFYSMGTHIARGTSQAYHLEKKADAYALRYAECDGMNVLDVYDTIHREAGKTRGSTSRLLGFDEDSAAGPVLINAITYRYQGHSMSDPQKYRTKDEVAQQQEKDCINSLVNDLIDRDLATQQQIDELDEKSKQAAQDAVKYAEASPDPGDEEMYTDVYINPFSPFKKGDLPIMLREGEEDD